MVGGDGFVSLIDPASHRIIFSESQDGFMGRIDKITNESKSIRPEAPLAEKPYRWNWDTPMMLSHADSATVYVGANKLLKSSDRGQTWTVISGDLTTGVDRDTLELMGVKGKDIKVAKNDGVDHYARTLLDRGIVALPADSLDRLRRRTGARVARRRRHLGQRHVEDSRCAEVRVRVEGRAVALRGRHGVRLVRQPSHRRLRHAISS